MLEEATKNAKSAALTFAENTGSGVGGIKNANQGIFTITSPDGLAPDSATLDKKVRVVTSIDFFLK